MTRTVANRGGRAPRPGVNRYKDGSIVRAERLPKETEEDIKATGLDARVRRNLGVDAWLSARGTPQVIKQSRRDMNDPLLSEENPLGRLLFNGRRGDMVGGITQDQYDAGQYFIWAYKRNARVTNPQRAQPVAIGANLVGGGDYTGPPVDDGVRYYSEADLDPDLAVDAEHEKEICRRIREVKERWADLEGRLKEIGVYSVVRKVLIDCAQIDGPADLGALRMGLNAVNRMRGV